MLAGIWHCGETVIKEEGVRALWKGLTPFAVHLTLKYALRMGTNAMYQSLLRDEVCHQERVHAGKQVLPAAYGVIPTGLCSRAMHVRANRYLTRCS